MTEAPATTTQGLVRPAHGCGHHRTDPHPAHRTRQSPGVGATAAARVVVTAPLAPAATAVGLPTSEACPWLPRWLRRCTVGPRPRDNTCPHRRPHPQPMSVAVAAMVAVMVALDLGWELDLEVAPLVAAMTPVLVPTTHRSNLVRVLMARHVMCSPRVPLCGQSMCSLPPARQALAMTLRLALVEGQGASSRALCAAPVPCRTIDRDRRRSSVSVCVCVVVVR